MLLGVPFFFNGLNICNLWCDKEIIALIAYLQRVGTDIKLEQKTAGSN